MEPSISLLIGTAERGSLSTDVPQDAVDDEALERIGVAMDERAAMRGLSERTVQQQWEKARIYLHRTIRPSSRI